MAHELIECTTLLDVPPTVRLCPHCGARLTAQFEHWSEGEDGWVAVGANVHCTSEPDIDGDEWEEWSAEHFHMPYAYWLPVTTAVLKWVNGRYRFNCDGGSDGQVGEDRTHERQADR